ncbi:MAG: O-acetyl-ADP-ribose deacetylase [Termitinemataceae bacterium]|nr:MAG: O-acetyl-ADP-ribose deacetylase [Termitinemataceae bacterium]
MTEIEVVHGDITKQKTDAIVSAGNATLVTGGGTLDRAVRAAAGPQLMECFSRIRNERGGCFVGEAIVVDGFDLFAKKIILTTGPMYMGGKNGEPQALAECYKNCLLAAYQEGCQSIAFPNISTGAYAYPKSDAANVAIKTVREILTEISPIKKIVFVCFDEQNYKIYKELLG